MCAWVGSGAVPTTVIGHSSLLGLRRDLGDADDTEGRLVRKGHLVTNQRIWFCKKQILKLLFTCRADRRRENKSRPRCTRRMHLGGLGGREGGTQRS